jgi:hypothetical protein
MMNTDENMPTRGTGKNGKAQSPAKKSAKRSRKPTQQEPAQQAAPEPEQVEQVQEPVTVATVAMENPFTDTAPDAPAATAPAEQEEAAQEKAAPVSLQTITNAYGDFTRKSIEQTSSFFEQLAGVRSLNRVFELQGEFAKQTCETFFAESRKIRELYSELAMQRLRHLEGFMARMKPRRSS